MQGSSEPDNSYIDKFKHNDSKGWGLLQWTYHTRKKASFDYSKKVNKKVKFVDYNVGDLIVQLEYFNTERKSTYKSAWARFKSKKTLADMVKSFCQDYEQAGIPHLDVRIDEAKRCEMNYKNKK